MRSQQTKMSSVDHNDVAADTHLFSRSVTQCARSIKLGYACFCHIAGTVLLNRLRSKQAQRFSAFKQ